MRMRKKKNLVPRMEACGGCLVRDPFAMRGQWRTLMPEARELRVELGCGKGRFTAETAAAEPDVLLIAVEKVPDAMVVAMERVTEAGLKNVFFVDGDAALLPDMFAPGEVGRFYINFCDPWPKKRHYKRRLTYVGFLEKYRRLLKQGGELHFKTDNHPLFLFSLGQFEEAELTVRDVSYDLHAENRPDNIMTEYERKFSGFGEKIHRCEVVFP